MTEAQNKMIDYLESFECQEFLLTLPALWGSGGKDKEADALALKFGKLVDDLLAEKADPEITRRLVEARRERHEWRMKPRPQLEDRTPEWSEERQRIIRKCMEKTNAIAYEVGDLEYRRADAACWRQLKNG